MIVDDGGVAAVTALPEAQREPSVPPPTGGFGRNRSAWTVADQIVSSAQSLLISLWVTHEVGLSGVGAFAIVFATYQILLATNRPLNGDPLAVGFSAAEPGERRMASTASTGGAVLLGLITAPVGVLAASVLAAPLGRPLSHAVIVFSLGGLAIVLQDAWRYVFFTDGRPARALVNDAVVLLAMPPACLLAGRLAPHSAASLIGGWCAATAMGALFGFWQTGIRPHLVRGWRWWRAILHFGAHVLGENLIANFAYAIGLAAAAAVAGVAALGRLRTAQVATNAANPLFLGIGTIVLADGTRFLASNPRRFPRLMVAGCTVAFVVPNLIALAWWLLPVSWGTVIVGSTWPVSRPLVLGAGAYVAGAAMSIVLSAGLRAMRFPSKAFKTRAVIGPITVTAAVVGARMWGPGGAIGGIAAAEWLYSVLMVPQFVAMWRERRWAGQRPVTTAGDGSWRR
ncbi:MAG TPA: hypothetical protein VHT30_00415 [Acidimicrobiales bacterium]|jgi:hypothetical protein|nr:hypothetical protein [Acidimicrobiales bacterium]